MKNLTRITLAGLLALSAAVAACSNTDPVAPTAGHARAQYDSVIKPPPLNGGENTTTECDTTGGKICRGGGLGSGGT